ncbi:MAG: aspartate carbamoyltransferase catalytic subunit [Deltaproteobacteria bacterium]|nr:aspartate carbamoyltransferase catalytic subunit [Deltaproteobacteria bacterium]
MTLSKRHLLSIADLTPGDVALIFQTAKSLKEISRRPVKKVPTLRGKTVINCFFEPSTRTRTSFEIAAKRLSADAVNFGSTGSALAKGESLIDTIRTLNAMQPDALVIRHRGSGVPALCAAQVRDCAVINAGDGQHEHPTQALLDAFTVAQAKGRVRGLTVAFLGDIAHSRVARSGIALFRKLGAKVLVAGPRSLLPVAVEALGAAAMPSIAEAVALADVLVVLRVQLERLQGAGVPTLREYARHFGLNAVTMKQAKPDVVIMHPGPINRGVEIDPELADGRYSLILDQVENGIAVRMACLYLYCHERLLHH